MFRASVVYFRQYSVPFATVAGLASVFHLASNSNLRSHLNDENKEAKEDYSERFDWYSPKSQTHKPKRPYPWWDDDWDLKQNDGKGNGVTRHIILIRHGQYDETYEEDEKRKLTELGRKQAHLTGKRIAELIRGGSSITSATDSDGKSLFKPCQVGIIRVSGMKRAMETAEIIGKSLPDNIIKAEPDPLLNEGIPAPIIPSRPELKIEEDLALNGERIEKAFQKYFSRSTNDIVSSPGSSTVGMDENKDQFEIIVCHANVIRFFFCRALQLPPEAWLRISTYNCSLTYLMIMPSGRVGCRMLGDIGHLGYENSTFSMHHGFV